MGVASLVEAVSVFVEDELDADIVRLVLDELGYEYVDDVPNEYADYFMRRLTALREENEE